MRKPFEEGQPVRTVFTMGEIWVRVHEIRHDIGKAYLSQDHLIVLGVFKGIIGGLSPCWLGFNAPNEFLVGYGLDHAKDFRHLPYIASL